MNKKRIGLSILGILFLSVLGILLFYLFSSSPLLSPLSSDEFSRYIRSLDQYSFSRLSEDTPVFTEITIEKTIKAYPTFTSYLFSFTSHGKKVTGLLNLPKGKGPFPVIVMVRGYVDKEIYYTGLGTKRGGEFFAENGYITIAPDFLGYGGSDGESNDIFEARFEKPRTIIDLLSAVKAYPKADGSRIGIWGHSNGGQITLSVLEITKTSYPTVLWAPVTQAFPDSIMQYIDELPDKGEYIKKTYGQFSEHYMPEDYSIASHYNQINAPIEIHQGLSDEEVDSKQTEKTVKLLKDLSKQVTYFTYPGENHNFTKGSFDTLSSRNLLFFQKYL